jgi:hypothetical protein
MQGLHRLHDDSIGQGRAGPTRVQLVLGARNISSMAWGAVRLPPRFHGRSRCWAIWRFADGDAGGGGKAVPRPCSRAVVIYFRDLRCGSNRLICSRR